MASPIPVLRLGARGSMLSKMQSQTVADAIDFVKERTDPSPKKGAGG